MGGAPKSPSPSSNALSALKVSLRRLFEENGFTPVDVPILQPGDIFLKRTGEDIRRRLYLFTDPEAVELCLRPDLTIPLGRYYLESRNPKPAKLSTIGPAFRYPTGPHAAHPREFTQAGIEWFGAEDKIEADAEITRIAFAALSAAGIQNPVLKIGDLSLFAALLDLVDMPESWRARLKRHFWRRERLKDMIAAMAASSVAASSTAARRTAKPAIPVLSSAQAEKMLKLYLEEKNILPAGVRSTQEIITGLMKKSERANAPELPPGTVTLLSGFLDIKGDPGSAIAQMEKLSNTAGIDFSKPLESFKRRIDLITNENSSIKIIFEAEFGRRLEYYTGFVFEFLQAGQKNATTTATAALAGGGRYDCLLSDIGSNTDIPAVGCALWPERILAAQQNKQQNKKAGTRS